MADKVFFAEEGEKRGWVRLAKALRSEVNEEALGQFSGVVSLPFSAGTHKRIAVKMVDHRGIESMVMKELR